MAFIKKIWKDRISQFPNRRTINDGYVTKQVTVGRDEGTITEQGDAFDATNMNDLEQRIEDAYGDIQALVGSEVAAQYNQENVIFDPVATEGHGTGFVVSSDYIAKLKVGDLADTDISGQAQGEALVFDADGNLVNGTPSLDVGDLSDVTISTPSNGEILVYNNGSWENQANPASTANFAPDYDDTATYNTNDKVIYQGLLYVCLEDNITGAWDSTKWQNISVADYNAELLPIESGSATNTKDYIDSGLSGKADTSDTYTKTEVDNLLGDKLDSAYLVTTGSGNFPALVKSNQVWLIAVQRVSLNTSLVILCHNYNGNILVKEIVKDSGMAYITNNQGTVSITYGGSGESVRGGAYRLA